MKASDRPSIHWRKSSRSAHEGGDCVEVAGLPGEVAVRDSKNPDGPVLSFARSEFRAFGHKIQSGRYSL